MTKNRAKIYLVPILDFLLFKMNIISGLLLFFSYITVIYCQEAPEGALIILPADGVVTKKIGQDTALTCKPNVQDPRLITQLEWRDPKGRKIESTNRASPMFIQYMPEDNAILLMFSKLTENQAGNYTCQGYYSNTQRIKNTVTLKTYESITFVDAKENQYPKVGEDFTIKCIVHGNPTPVVDWYKNDELIVNDERHVINTEGLLIKNVRESDDGVYKCNAVVILTGDVKSRDIKVEVLVPPSIQPMEDVSIVEGETASIRCTGKGKPPPTYTWIKENTGQDLSKTDRFDVRKTTGDLIINRIEFNDNANYKCIARNPAGEAERIIKINVLVKPKIYELLNVTAPIKTETKLICKVQGRPPPQVTFRKLSNKEPFKIGQQDKDKRIIVEREIFEDKGESFGTLIITDLNRTDDGLYECIAENKAGKAYKNGHITVEFPPTFERTKEYSLAWIWLNRPGNLTCLPEAIPNATIKWRFNRYELSDNQNFKIIGHGPVSHLIVKAYNEPRFYGDYECEATNKHGTASTMIHLREARVPEAIVQVKRHSVTATTIRFNIEPPSFFDSLPIRSIVVQYKPAFEFSWDNARNHTWSFNAPYILEDLIPQTTYHFRFAARNDVGQGPWTNAETIEMPRRSEPAEPKILIPNHKDHQNNFSNRDEIITTSPYADHFELRWNVPNDNGDPIDMYLIRYCVSEKINGAWRDGECSEEIKQSVQHTSYDLNNLKGDTVYKIELRAHNAIGSSSPAQIRVRTARGMDLPIPNNNPSISSATIIGLVVAGIILVLLFVDLVCFCVNRAGILAFFCNKTKTKQEEDPKLSREEKEPLTPQQERPKCNGMEKSMSVEFDGKQVYSKSGEIIGKHSAV